MATEALLKTKLYVPRAHTNLVQRPRLSQRLSEGTDRKLTLVSAPAGFGKSTLLSEWQMMHRGSDNPVAWISLEKTDNDVTRFLSYLITALQTIEANIGAGALVSLQSSPPLAIEAVLTALINEIAATPRDFTLVLDDYHVIEAGAIHGALAFLLEHLPRQMHLILCGRTDPPLPLSRLRVQNQITELRADDLRFTPEEAAAFLNDLMDLHLPAEDVMALAAGTEGWIAALQLAALSMRNRSDVSGFVDAFKGSHRYVLDYLTEEVLERQSARVQTFLLETSILDRLTAKLCDEVTGGDDGQALLERLERANLFTIPLDDERLWYRYHHLFADMLRHRLHQGPPERVACLNRRAARWYERQRLVDDAIGHTLAAGDNAWTAQLVEQNTEATVMRSEGATLLRWLEALPEELVRSRPRLCIAHAIASLFGGRLEDVEPLLQNAEHALGSTSDSPESSSADDGTGGWLADIPSCLVILRGDLARMRGEVPRAIEFSRQALARLPAGTSYLRSKATWNLGIASWLRGDLVTADEAFAELIAANRASGNAYLPVLASSGLGLLRAVQGRLREAAEAYRGALRLGSENGKVWLPVAGWAHLGLGDLLREWNDLDAAMHHLEEGIELGKRVGQAGPLATGYTILARLRQTRGEASGALEAIEKARQAAPDPNLHQLFGALAPHWARVWLEQGDLAAAVRWARECGLSIDDELGFVREPEHIVLARVFISLGEHDKALQLLGCLLLAAQAGRRTGRIIEILVLQALARLAEGHTSLAVSTLGRALPLAEPEGYVRVFADEGAPMTGLLRRVSGGGTSPEYAGELLAACEQATGDRAPRTKSAVDEGYQSLSEPLSERELEVLRLIAFGQSNREIARELYVSLGTIKTHINHTYRKLGVHSRTRAVARARDLKLI